MGAVIGSWVALVGGVLGAVCGLVFFAWATETVDLDDALMPIAESALGVEPPRSRIGRGERSTDELRADAAAASTHGDLPAAVVLWRRVMVREPADDRAPPAIRRLLSQLGDPEGAS
jgi:hypothetical protein